MAKKRNQFIIVPLGMLKELIYNHNTIHDIFYVGSFLSAQKMCTNLETAAKQYIYCIFRDIECIPGDLYDCVDEMEDFEWDEEYNGFSWDTFDPEDNMECVLEYADLNHEFADELMEWHRTRVMFETMNLKTKFLPITINRAKEILSENNYFRGDPNFTVDRDVIVDLYAKASSKTEEELAALAMYWGMLSIIGKKRFAATTSFAIQSRMFGAKDKNELDKLLKNKKTRELYEKYTTRRKYEKLRDMVKERYGINYFGYNHLTFITFKYMDDREFFEAIYAADKKRQKRIMMAKRHEIMKDVIKKDHEKD